tara:strand:+ start:250 stop:507 length:258 start_codon:yes stop_codon:yes gene_type:complete
MNTMLVNIFICLIKIYKYLLSPLLVNKCRFLPTCSEYFIDSLKIHGLFKGSCLGLKRILKCHPITILGGSSGIDFVPKKGNNKNG